MDQGCEIDSLEKLLCQHKQADGIQTHWWAHTYGHTQRYVTRTHTHTQKLQTCINKFILIYYIRQIIRFSMLGVEPGCIIFLSSSATQNWVLHYMSFEFLDFWTPSPYWVFPQTQTPLSSSLCTEITSSTRA